MDKDDLSGDPDEFYIAYNELRRQHREREDREEVAKPKQLTPDDERRIPTSIDVEPKRRGPGWGTT